MFTLRNKKKILHMYPCYPLLSGTLSVHVIWHVSNMITMYIRTIRKDAQTASLHVLVALFR